MKTKEEIEQLANKTYFNVDSSEDFIKHNKRIFIKGYTQCQEDMAEKKYTEDDMRKCWDNGRKNKSKYQETLHIDFDDYINSLNKQE